MTRRPPARRKPETRGPRVGPDMVVTVAYRLYDERDRQCDASPRSAPLTFVHGYAQVIPGLERGLSGATPGERRQLTLAPDQAFGERDPEALLTIDRADFPGGERARPGDEILATAPDGSECAYRIVALDDDGDIVADRNHPLAGQRVRFDVIVLKVRPADEHEIAAAQADADERIAYANTIVYGSVPEDRSPHPGALVHLGKLVHLHKKPKP